MHIYLYDAFTGDKRYEKVLARIETRITDLGLNGKIVRLGISHSIENAIENEIKKGAKTIIAVGNIKILNQAINVVARLSHLNPIHEKTPLGFIPVGKKLNTVADVLGIGPEEEACNILSARRIQELDLGQANNNYFLTEATISTNNSTVEIDQDYSIEINEGGEIAVLNLPLNTDLPDEANVNAEDGRLELFIKTANKAGRVISKRAGNKQSLFSFSKLRIVNTEQPVLIDETVEVASPVDINIAAEKINMIVGKERRF